MIEASVGVGKETKISVEGNMERILMETCEIIRGIYFALQAEDERAAQFYHETMTELYTKMPELIVSAPDDMVCMVTKEGDLQ